MKYEPIGFRPIGSSLKVTFVALQSPQENGPEQAERLFEPGGDDDRVHRQDVGVDSQKGLFGSHSVCDDAFSDRPSKEPNEVTRIFMVNDVLLPLRQTGRI